MWKAILTQTKGFLELLDNTAITVDEWRKQKEIYKTQNKKYSLELGFATFFLNRTNRSGVLNAGPIGGLDQTGKYKIDVRFNKEELAKRIELIAKHKKKIHLYNHDIRSFLELFLPRYQEHAFVYFDPPYFIKGKQLYKNFFSEDDHQQILELIQKLQCPWMVTYDNTDRIKEIYEKYNCWYFDLSYGVANSGKNSEILFVSDDSILPSCDDQKTIKINFRNQP